MPPLLLPLLCSCCCGAAGAAVVSVAAASGVLAPSVLLFSHAALLLLPQPPLLSAGAIVNVQCSVRLIPPPARPVCNNHTYHQCMELQMFGLPQAHWCYVQHIRAG